MSNAPNLRHPDCLFIGGAWVELHSGRQLEIISSDLETKTIMLDAAPSEVV